MIITAVRRESNSAGQRHGQDSRHAQVGVAGQIGPVCGEELSECAADVSSGPGVERVEEELQAFLGLSPGCPEQLQGAGLEADSAR